MVTNADRLRHPSRCWQTDQDELTNMQVSDGLARLQHCESRNLDPGLLLLFPDFGYVSRRKSCLHKAAYTICNELLH